AELQARLAATRQELAALEAELARYDAEETVDLVRLQRDLLTLQAQRNTQRLLALESRINALKTRKDAERVRQARYDTFATGGPVTPAAQRNLELAEESQLLTQRIAQADSQLKSVRQSLEELRKQARQTQKKVEDVGLTGAVGLA